MPKKQNKIKQKYKNNNYYEHKSGLKVS